MSKGDWKREPITDIPVMQIPEHYLKDGVFDTSSYSDSNLFGDRNFAAFLGLRLDKFQEMISVGSHFHTHPIKAENGSVIGNITHVNSATWGYEENYKPAAKQRMLAGKKPTDVSFGSETEISGTLLPKRR